MRGAGVKELYLGCREIARRDIAGRRNSADSFHVEPDVGASRDRARDQTVRMREIEVERDVVLRMEVRLPARTHLELPLLWPALVTPRERVPKERVGRRVIAPVAMEHKPALPPLFVT
jgi:hypothetical protein